MKPITPWAYQTRRRVRLNRLARLKTLKAPEIILQHEQLMLLWARYLYYKPDRLEEFHRTKALYNWAPPDDRPH